MVYPHHRLLFCNRKEWTISTCNNLDGSQRHNAKFKKPHSESHILHNSMSVIFSSEQNCRYVEYIDGSQELETGVSATIKK